MSCQEDQYSYLDNFNVNICPLLLQWATIVCGAKLLQTDREQTEKPITEASVITRQIERRVEQAN